MSDVSGARLSLQKEIETTQKVDGKLSTSVSFHPRWVRINTLRTTTKEQLQSTFSEYEIMSSLEELCSRSLKSADIKCLAIDEHIPDLLALPPNSNIQKTSAYLSGMIILQDKASCFPAYILGSCSEDGDLIDACAAPGNKTTHLAAILQNRCGLITKPKILACERDKDRAATLQNMIDKAGAQELIIVRPGQDFLKTKPQERPWNSARSFLLDPSCSGSGMTGRDENFRIFLPQHKPDHASNTRPQKRKRVAKSKHDSTTDETKEETPALDGGHDVRLSSRLEALSTFQLKLLLHAFKFPRAKNVVYSTCSIYAEENEHVVLKALDSAIAQERHWRIRKREEQVSGAKTWAIRGDLNVCHEHFSHRNQHSANEIAEACIRCEKNTSEGTQGFFVAAFVRDDSDDDHLVEKCNAFDPVLSLSSHMNSTEFNHEWDDIEEEWEGFNDETTNSDRISE